MRPGNNNRRGRNRGPRKPHGIGGKPAGFDGGSEYRVRGNVYQLLEKYLQLARDAGVSGDRIAAENFLQHAEHYYRVIAAMNEGQRPRIGGREVSVADFNVQNVSQGLSAALYGGPAPAQSLADTGAVRESGGREHEHRPPPAAAGNGHEANAGLANEDGEDGDGDGEAMMGEGEMAASTLPPHLPEEQPDYPAELLPNPRNAAPAAPPAEGEENAAAENYRRPRFPRQRRPRYRPDSPAGGDNGE